MERPKVNFWRSYNDLKVYNLLEIIELPDDKLDDLPYPEIKFIDPNASKSLNYHDTVSMTSFSRAGNTMLRAYMEKITGLATGSDGNMQMKMVKDLFNDGFVGESLMDKRV